ncbi:ABC transporter substrate-binding protein [Aureimonas frigidaquae]|uniref:Putative branched-chain amino acid ABC transporter substrate binding protein n=1 Tax=Aureimonas frigidaquae TaxID=424757 RepID=A0A0P0Z0G4_9HYPH|nr:ABC transporter substrate-binding protein [Aureimonas frigidaquae]BAT27432.1 putative branched-chain amino acid ABC transporter substrate binding protein [Aureimonas frigidaquae]
MKRRHFLAGAGLLTLAATFTVSAPSIVLAQDGPIRIAALYNLTGGMSSIDAPALNGARLKAKEINDAGGIDGRQVEIVAYDTRTDQGATATAAQEAVSADVVAGIGYGDTTFVMAAAPTFQSAGIPFVTSGATHPKLPEWVGDHMFMTAFGDDDQSFAIADYAIDELKLDNVMVWTDNSMDFTKALSTFFKERYAERGKTILEDVSFMMGDTDFSGQIARLKALDPQPDAVFISAIPSEAGVTVRQIREAGLDLPILSGDGFDTPLVAEVPGPDLANKVYFSTHTYLADDRPEVAAFIAAYEKEFGTPPENAFAPLGYDAVGLIANAIETAGSAEPSAIRDALAKTEGFKAVTGEISYSRATMVPPKPISIVGVDGGTYSVLSIWRPESAQ